MALVDPCLYLQADAHPARTFRQLITATFGEGILGSTSFAVTERPGGDGGPNFSVSIAAGMAVVTGDSNAQQGRYLVVNDAIVNDATTAVTSAPSAGNERYDRVILEVQDNAEDASGQNRPRFRVVAGTPAAVGTASAPALPNTAITLAVIGPILNSTTTITNSLITDGRSAARLTHQVVDTAAIVDANVTTAKIADSAITTAKIADGTIVAADLASAVLSSAWANATLAAGWSAPSGDVTQTVRYKKVGNTVFVYGGATRSGATTGMGTLTTLPAGFRPPGTFKFAIFNGTNAANAVDRASIDSSGVVTVFSVDSGQKVSLSVVFEAA